MTAAPAVRYLGTTSDVVNCEKCGRVDLRCTVVLEFLDADGNGEGVTYYGSTCAARALSARTGRKVTAAGVRAEAEAAATATARAAEEATRLLDHYGPAEDDDAALVALYRDAHRNAMWAARMTDAEWLDKARAMFVRHRAALAAAAALRPAAA